MKRTLTSLLAVIAAATTISAKVTLPEIIGDNMILQQQTKVRIWGKAPAGNTVYIITSWSREKTKVTCSRCLYQGEPVSIPVSRYLCFFPAP